MNPIDFFVLGFVGFMFGGMTGVLKDTAARNREYKLEKKLKESDDEILRLRAQVAKFIGT
jgi:hypothetical protein